MSSAAFGRLWLGVAIIGSTVAAEAASLRGSTFVTRIAATAVHPRLISVLYTVTARDTGASVANVARAVGINYAHLTVGTSSADRATDVSTTF